MLTPLKTCSSPVLKFSTIGSLEKACASQGNPALGWTRKQEMDSWPLGCLQIPQYQYHSLNPPEN